MLIEVPESELGSTKLSQAEAKLDLAIGLYTGRHLSIGKSAKLAGISHSEFLHELGRRSIPVNYGENDLVHDLNELERLKTSHADDRRK